MYHPPRPGFHRDRPLRKLVGVIGILSLVACTLNTDAPTPQILGITGGDAQTTAAGTPLPNPLTVIVIDQFGNAMSNVTVTWAIASGDGSLSATTTVTGQDGTSSVTYTAGPTPGTAKITATVAGIGSLTFTETIT